MSEQIASGLILVAGLFVAATLAGYVLLQRPHHHHSVGKRVLH
jgi:preprotein translocase subunit SecG